MDNSSEPIMKTKSRREKGSSYLLLFPALLLIGLGFGLGRTSLELEHGVVHRPAENRDSFCRLDWIIQDFQAEFVSAYCELMFQFAKERSAWKRFQGEYKIWLEENGFEDAPCAWEIFRLNHPSPPDYDPGAWTGLLIEKLTNLEERHPAPLVIKHLLLLLEEEGETEEFERLRALAKERFPGFYFGEAAPQTGKGPGALGSNIAGSHAPGVRSFPPAGILELEELDSNATSLEFQGF